MTKEIRQVLSVCPGNITEEILKQPEYIKDTLEEIRLRNQRQVMLLSGGGEYGICAEADTKSLEYILGRATGQAVYSALEMLKNGYVTLPGGHRLGICGRAVYKSGEIFTIKEISSVNLRIARQFFGIANQCADYIWTRPYSTLIIGPPGRGKTTYLRDLIRQLSDRFGWRISVADERMEIASCHEGKPQFDLGKHTDILSGAEKATSMEMLLRAMNPQWIALDEITSERDVNAMLRLSYCGVHFLATAHAANRRELAERPVYLKLLESGIFRNLCVIQRNRQVRMERMDEND